MMESGVAVGRDDDQVHLFFLSQAQDLMGGVSMPDENPDFKLFWNTLGDDGFKLLLRIFMDHPLVLGNIIIKAKMTRRDRQNGKNMNDAQLRPK